MQEYRLRRLGAVVVTTSALKAKNFKALGYVEVSKPQLPVKKVVAAIVPKDEVVPDAPIEYKCSKCGKVYQNEGYYKKHMLEKHKIEI